MVAMANPAADVERDFSKIRDTEWPGSCPSKYEQKLLSVVCGNSHLHWAVHEGVGKDFMPMLFWRTPIVTEDDMNNHDPCAVLERFLPNGGHEIIFGSPDAAAEKAQAAKASAERRIPTLGVYVVSTNVDNEAGVSFLFRDIPCRMHRFTASDFFSKEQGAYDRIGIDRLACLKAASHFYKYPVLVIDGGTALTYTAADAAGNIIGGGIAQGLASKFRSMHDHTGALPLVEYDTFMDMISKAEKEKKPLPSFASDTETAMVVAGLTETARLCCNIVKHCQRIVEEKKQGNSTMDVDRKPLAVCITGGDGDVIEKLLQPDHSYIIEVDPDSKYSTEGLEIQKHKHLPHYGISALLKDKMAGVQAAETEEDKLRAEIVGQRVAKKFRLRGGEDLFRGSVAAITSGNSLDDDWFYIRYDDGDTEHVNIVQLYDGLVLYADVGESYQPDEITQKKIEESKATTVMLVEKSEAVKKHHETPLTQRKTTPGNRKRAPDAKSSEKSSKKAKNQKTDPRALVGTRVAKYFGSDVFFGTITKHIPANISNENELWHILYDDNDEEDYDKKDMRKAKALYKDHEAADPKRSESKVSAVSTVPGSEAEAAEAEGAATEPAPEEDAPAEPEEPAEPTEADDALPLPSAVDGDALL